MWGWSLPAGYVYSIFRSDAHELVVSGVAGSTHREIQGVVQHIGSKTHHWLQQGIHDHWITQYACLHALANTGTSTCPSKTYTLVCVKIWEQPGSTAIKIFAHLEITPGNRGEILQWQAQSTQFTSQTLYRMSKVQKRAIHLTYFAGKNKDGPFWSKEFLVGVTEKEYQETEEGCAPVPTKANRITL